MNIQSNTPLQNPPTDYFTGQANWFTIPEGQDAGKKIFYYDHTPGSKPDRVILFVHGNPESSYTYRHIRDELIEKKINARILAVDHIGFGLSDRATYEMIDMHHSANLRLLVKELDLKNVILVVHDWGGPIGIGAFIDEPERLAGLVVMNTTVFPMPREGFTYTNYPYRAIPWALSPRIVPPVLWGGIAAFAINDVEPTMKMPSFLKSMVANIRAHVAGLYSQDTAKFVWSEMFRDKTNARSSMRLARQTPVWGHGYEYTDARLGKVSNKAFYRNIHDHIASRFAHIQAAGVFGEWDPCGKIEVIRQWHEALPQMEGHTTRFPDVGHFVEEVKGREIAQEILKMI